MADAIEQKCNFGGFIPISTVDWPGYAASVLFMRGCPNLCKDCHNRYITSGSVMIPISEIFDMIKLSSPYVSSLVISGGEPTSQPEELISILNFAKTKDIKTKIQTSGIYPDVIQYIINNKLVSNIALDIKVNFMNNDKIIPKDLPITCIEDSLLICERAKETGHINDFEVVHTIFPYDNYEDQLRAVSDAVNPDTIFVLQQGHPLNRIIEPITRDQLWELARHNIRQHNIRIRTRSNGEEIYHEKRDST